MIDSRAKLHKKEKKKKKMLWAFIAIVVILLTAFLYYTESGRYDIKELKVAGVSIAKSSEIENEVNKQVALLLWNQISRRNFLLYPREDIEKKIIEDFPSAKSVEVEAGFSEARVIISERIPKYLWCDAKCYFVDEEGVIFAPSANFLGSTYIKLYGQTDENIVKSPLGKSLGGIATMRSIDNLLLNLKEIGIIGVSVEWKGKHEIVVKTADDLEIFVKISPDNKKLTETIRLVLDKANEDEGRKVMQIDARIENKVYLTYNTPNTNSNDTE